LRRLFRALVAPLGFQAALAIMVARVAWRACATVGYIAQSGVGAVNSISIPRAEGRRRRRGCPLIAPPFERLGEPGVVAVAPRPVILVVATGLLVAPTGVVLVVGGEPGVAPVAVVRFVVIVRRTAEILRSEIFGGAEQGSWRWAFERAAPGARS
jgi:hypothetical protein